ncbi:hypothetical protein [Chitinophaga sp. LS1]|uniref:hypothetical protein n=1 Tax=Chitinophaga sp. LS1 TaxID=3051176 RepID=UPI002AAB2A31|nr:hypothetical protein [Chitinophaga sp. LS1]WPV64829.1 hypothetical protein QQL36_23790 [Chitinophaga sp. LS1]
MNAIVPLNIAALRVNQNDYDKVAGNFQGKTALFEKMPWADPGDSYTNMASTGDKIFQPLGLTSSGGPLVSPNNSLGAGIHLHWELPDYFKKGQQLPGSSNILFPHAPNRWLVTRYLSIYDQSTNSYAAPTAKSWIVESDYITSDKPSDGRPHITVPLPVNPAYQQQPYMYMGRVVDHSSWNPSTEPASSYLPSQQDTDGNPCYLTSIGFVGPYFSSYYPECCSVFGFWDNFSDLPDVQSAIKSNNPIQFRATYQVIGWLNDVSTDPLNDIRDQVTEQYNDYVQRCLANNTVPEMTPLDFFSQITTQNLKWTFNNGDLSYSVNDEYQITQLNLPTQTLCAGTMQEVVWNMTSNTGSTYFLSSGQSNMSVWNANTEIAIGNSTEEALSALLKIDMGQDTDDPNVLTNYEYLLDALQLGLLNDIEKTPNKLITLEEALHNNGFENISGGFNWLITNTKQGTNDGSTEDTEITLPLTLAEQLYLLNSVQKQYDMGRGALSMRRKQLFMDWIRYVKMFQGETSDSYIQQGTMNNFIYTSTAGELNDVISYGNSVGLLQYTIDEETGQVSGILAPGSGVSTSSLAYAVYNNYQTVLNALTDINKQNTNAIWTLQCDMADYFQMPAEPVILMEGDMMEPPQRNGDGDTTFVRLSTELLTELLINYNSNNFTVNATAVPGVPAVNTNMPAAIQSDAQTLTGEAFLTTPMLAGQVASALASAGGNGNPAVASLANCTLSLMYAQGGLSPLDIAPNPGGVPTPPANSLFALINSSTYQPGTALVINVTGPQALSVTWTNANNDGYSCGSVGWNTQNALPEFSTNRVDPFMPIFMIWNVNLSPLQWVQDHGNQLYAATNITDYFNLDADGVDYVYKMNGTAPLPFTSPTPVSYDDDATMRSGATGVLSFQITNYINNNPTDLEDNTLKQIAALYDNRKILSQSMSGFNSNLVLTSYVAQVAVENLVAGRMDSITPRINTAAGATANDNWYDDAFTNLEPIPTGLLAQGNFGPLRAGFMDILSIEIVDAFGQRMDLQTATRSPQGGLSCITSYAMTPNENDKQNQGRIYLSPRIVTPTRTWFKWLSATHNNEVTGVSDDFVETNSHPATAPICGWVMPNHLDNDLFFYDIDGSAIGTFGVEHGQNVYRTRAGNIANAGTSEQQLAVDIGQRGTPTVNPHVANFMWFLFNQSGAFLEDMMTAIQDSETFVSPSNYAQDNSLAVLIGRPLAITRAILGLETMGNLLPLNQADNNAQSPFPQDVNNQRYSYPTRMPHSSANLGNVLFPVRLGDLANLDDGLVAYVLETTNSNPYTQQPLYMPAAKAFWKNGVTLPTDTTIQVTLNQQPIAITMLVDPRAAVHATTGVLAVSELVIPPDQYSDIMNNLAVNFTTRPMLQMAQGMTVPLPAESGYSWSWITPGAANTTALKANVMNETPVYGYSPQVLQEGWLVLSPIPPENNQQ